MQQQIKGNVGLYLKNGNTPLGNSSGLWIGIVLNTNFFKLSAYVCNQPTLFYAAFIDRFLGNF